jgi:hypothetical protein
MGGCCCELIESLDDGVLVVSDTQKFSFDGGITATADPSDPNLVHVALGGIGAVSLQLAYDGGEVIVTDAQGAIDLTRGGLTPDGEPLLTLADANANPGRTVSLLSLDDSNVVGAGEPGTLRITRTTAGIAVTLRSLGAGVEMQEVALVPGGAPAATFGKWWVRNDAPNVPMFTDDTGVDHVLVYSGGVSLQNAYDAGESITTDAQGAIDLVRGVLTPDGEPLLTLADANPNPGRTVAMLAIDDSNVVGAGEPGTIRVTRTTAGIAITLRSLGAGVEMQEVATVPGGASAATFGKWWVRNDAPNVPMFTDDTGVDHVLVYSGGVSLQNAYDAGEAVSLDAQGAIDVTRSASCPDGESALQIIDANANPGRSVAAVFINDSNVVVAGTPSLEVRTGTAMVNLLLSSTDAGALGPTLSTFHNSATPAVSDVPYTVSAFAKDNGGGTKEIYREEVSVIDQDAAAYDALYQMKIRRGSGGTSVLARVMQMRATNPATDAGSLWTNDVAVGANPPFTRRAGNNFGAAQAVDRVQDNNGASTLWQVDGDGDGVLLQDIEAAGGYQKSLGLWTHALIAGQTDVQLTLVSSIANDWVAFRAGSITGIATRTNGGVTAGTLTINVLVNGVIVFTSAITATTTVTTQAKDVDAIVAGDLITVSYTSSLAFNGPTLASVEVEIEE